ncbi:Uncharacterized protein PECH_006947 [Penicillium ucsense]|uniref:Uncharacterized protein n=1 Tax=Penicillium ucsense TaxID=2839758 RepID=A0A8J8W4R1_9EURO|nr:Uncharacterized protein PECM_005080 [Penicillium ucsense]KAF7738988.1 Uncharacterized protein PECH_006947 [Penicillium ucsense]
MGDQGISNTQRLSQDLDREFLPNYEESQQGRPTAPSRYGSFPATTSLHGQWTKLKSMNLCAGENAKNRLCSIEMQTGYSGKPPLGMRTGIVLRSGMSNKDPVLAAAGDESQGLHAFNPDGIVFLPPLNPDSKIGQLDAEELRAEAGPNSSVAFRFSVETGEDNLRQDFLWTKVKRGANQAKRNGFRLTRLVRPSHMSPTSAGGSIEKASSSSLPSTSVEGETVANLGWAWPSLTHAFTLEIVDGQSSVLGARWTLMVTVTAIRLYTLHVKGKTSKFVFDIGKKN